MEAVLLASKLSARVELAVAALEAGKNVLCEVPIAPSLEGADRVFKASRGSSGIFQPCFAMRHSPSTVMGREAVRRGEVGSLISITCTSQLVGLSNEAKEGSIANKVAQVDSVLHLVDLARWFSRSEPELVYAAAVGGLGAESKMELGFTATMRFASGVVSSIDALPSRRSDTLGEERLVMEILGNEGLVRLDAFSQAVSVHGQGRPQGMPTRYPWGCNVWKEMLKSFLACVRRGAEPVADAFDARQATEAAVAVQRSAHEQRQIRLPLTSSLKG